ncbi:hypothetical protein G9C98_000560 [Cotesia typhae]|uniref:Uncharacterized protein n=1 Tax=Cotesia typhae TaxID=2053667 RepID=A0A8J5REU8_9HYME|nr:hypothetical protein G9C98_000560 [Cotesia typhae]
MNSLATEEEDTIVSHLRDSKLFTTSNSSLELSTEDRSSYYARKYPRLAKLEEVCSQIEEESELEFRNCVKSHKTLNFTVQNSNSSETLLSDSSTITASESGYDAEDSMSFTIQTINDLLDCQIDDSVSKSGSFQDSLIHQSSLSSTQTSYMELKEILRTFSISEQNLEIFSDDSQFFQLQSRFIRTLIKLPEDFQIQLRTILEESDKNSHSSVDFFKSWLLHAMDNTKSVHERAISSHPVLRPLKLAKASVSPGSQSQSLHPDSTELKSSDLNELSFTTIEKICMQDELPQTPKPMPGLTEEQKKSLELCQKQELELLSESPYSSQSSGSKRCVESRDGGNRKARSLVDSEGRRPASSYLTSSSDWDIRKEVLHADLHQSWMEFSSKKEQENKTRKSYADEFMEMVNRHFQESDKSKNPCGLKESTVQAATARSTKNFKASKSSSKSSMGIKKINGSKRKITTGFIKKRSLIPIRKSGISKSATISKAKVSFMLDMIYSTSENQESRIPAGEEIIVSGTLPNLLDKKSTSSLLTPNSTGRSGNSESLSSGSFNPGAPIPMISITCPSPNTEGIKSPFNTSPGPKNYKKFQRKYFCTPGRKPAPKKKRIFFPTPEKNIFSKTPKIEKSSGYICSKPIEIKVKSPVGAYIRGVLSASAIADPDRVREFLAK